MTEQELEDWIADNETTDYVDKLREFNQENNQVWAEYARLLDVAEDCACASTKDEAIELLENYKDSVEITNTLNKIKADAIREAVLDNISPALANLNLDEEIYASGQLDLGKALVEYSYKLEQGE